MKDDRSHIARDVVVSIVTVIFVVLGLASSVTNYMVRPETEKLTARIEELQVQIEKMQRSNAAYYGQIKSMLKEEK